MTRPADQTSPTAVFQPIVELADGRTVAFEALARFSHRDPAEVFGAGRRAGCDLHLQAASLRAALAAGRPAFNARLAVNVSASALGADVVRRELPRDLSNVTIELTEHELVRRGDRTTAVLLELRARGAELAVDDAGAGYASLRQIMELQPDVIKLDRSLISGVDADLGRRMLIETFVGFARRIGSKTCAEGVETLEELRTVADLDVDLAQGFVFARPEAPWAEIDGVARETCVRGGAEALDDARGPADALQLEALGRDISHARTVDDIERCARGAARLLGVQDVAISRSVPGMAVCGDMEALAGPRWRAPWALAGITPSFPTLPARVARVHADDACLEPSERAFLSSHRVTSVLVAPIERHGRIVGVLDALSRGIRPATRRQILLARWITHQLALALPALPAPRAAARGGVASG